MINKEYGIYFKKGDQKAGSSRPIDIYESRIPIKEGSILRPNTLNRRFNVTFEAA